MRVSSSPMPPRSPAIPTISRLASDELAHLHWVPVAEARALNLPFITEVVLAEVAALAGHDGPPPSVPFFDNSGATPTFRRLA